MLLQRIITASILAILIISSVLYLSAIQFSLVIALVVLIGAWEWTFLSDIEKPILRALFLVALIFPMLGITFWTQFLEIVALKFEWPNIREYSGILEWLVIPAVLFWIVVMILLRQLPRVFLDLKFKPFQRAFTGWSILLAAWMFLSRLHLLYGSQMVLYFLILIWMADISAYFIGKKFGKDKLSPDISPGKTVQGMYGALGSAVICGVAMTVYNGYAWISIIDFTLLSVLTVLISIYGDLFFSMAKRKKGVKDSGIIFPGHGGVLDRIDSIIAASPFFYAGVTLIGFGFFS